MSIDNFIQSKTFDPEYLDKFLKYGLTIIKFGRLYYIKYVNNYDKICDSVTNSEISFSDLDDAFYYKSAIQYHLDLYAPKITQAEPIIAAIKQDITNKQIELKIIKPKKTIIDSLLGIFA